MESTLLRKGDARVVLDAEVGTDAERFAELFRETWERLPKYARRRILELWRGFDRCARDEGLPRAGKLPFKGIFLYRKRDGRRADSDTFSGCHVVFLDELFAQKSSEESVGTIGAALAHVYWNAAEYQVLGGFLGGDWLPTTPFLNRPWKCRPSKRFAELLACAWGFEQGHYPRELIEDCKNIAARMGSVQGIEQFVERVSHELGMVRQGTAFGRW
jgi:hypothetical protein